jgi:hypothetical protein
MRRIGVPCRDPVRPQARHLILVMLDLDAAGAVESVA